jgi:hypothetical protein
MLNLFIFLAVFGTTCLGNIVIPRVRHYDFLHPQKLEFIPLESSLTLQFSAFNETYTLKLESHQHLIPATATLHLHHAFGGPKQLHPIVAHPYHGSLVDALGDERGWARILFHQEYALYF